MSNTVLTFPVYKMETGNLNRKNFRFAKWKLEILWFTLRKPEKFPVCEMETGNFTVYVM